ncbi:MAG: chorismate--pyruvate lyase [Lachnospiraceae bacterium]
MSDLFARKQYVVERIDGDYAYLRNLDNTGDELKCVARALLPEETGEGTKLVYEMMSYEIM